MALGMGPDLEPEIQEIRLERGDWVILCTDGFEAEQVAKFEAWTREMAQATDSMTLMGGLIEDFWKAQLFADNAAALFIRVS
jgi:serine/threonine protein phosphatase PrpC